MAVVVDNAAIQAVQISVWKKAFISLKGAPLIPLFIIVVFILSAILAALPVKLPALHSVHRPRLNAPLILGVHGSDFKNLRSLGLMGMHRACINV